jgi:hypothetical protein
VYYQQPPQQAHYGSRYSGCLKFFLYVISFLIPFLGVILGLIYMSRRDPESERLGKACVILSIVSIVIACCIVVVSILGAVGLPLLTLPFLEGY